MYGYNILMEKICGKGEVKRMIFYMRLFAAGAVMGWALEVIYRSFISPENPCHTLVNPGYCHGPYLPIYGFGLCFLYTASEKLGSLDIDNEIIRNTMAAVILTLSVTALEYAAGRMCIDVLGVRLWDYSENFGNIGGIICPQFSLCWGMLAVIYFKFLHPVLSSLEQKTSLSLPAVILTVVFYIVFMADLMDSCMGHDAIRNSLRVIRH